MANRLQECHRALRQDGSLYLHCDPNMSHKLKLVLDAIFGSRNFRNEIVWSYRTGGVSKKWFGRKHDVILFYVKSEKSKYTFNVLKERPYSTNSPPGFKGIEKNQDEFGRWYTMASMRDVRNINAIGRSSKERMGYPTQKPIALLERVLKASNIDGVVMDPFCGCGTTIHAAQNLGMPWIGIDICAEACKVIQNRIENHFDSIWGKIEFVGMPKTLDDARTLAEYNSFKLERWAASLAPGMNFNQKQVADKGIDGWGRYPIKKGVFVDVVAQVKGGGTGPSDVQAFNGARLQANADMGVFTCFEDRVTHAMKDAAVNTGRFQKWPVLQIYTVEDYFAERKPDLPLAV